MTDNKKSDRIEFRISPTHSRLIAAHLAATPTATKAQFFADATRRELLHPAQRRLWEISRDISRAANRDDCTLVLQTDRPHLQVVIPNPNGQSDWITDLEEGAFTLPEWGPNPGGAYKLSAIPVPFVARTPDPTFPTRDRLALGVRLKGESAPYGGGIVALLYDGYAPRDSLPHFQSVPVSELHERASLVDPDSSVDAILEL